VIGTVIPGGTVRIDVGNSSPHTDSKGSLWLADTLGVESGSTGVHWDLGPQVWSNDADSAFVYNTYLGTWGDDLEYGPFVVANGTYQITFMLGNAGSGPLNKLPFYNGLVLGPVSLEAQGQGTLFDWTAAAKNGRVGVSKTITTQVTNNLLYVAVRALGGQNAHSVTLLNGLTISPK